MKDIVSLEDFLHESSDDFKQSDRRRVTAILSFDKVAFQTEAQTIAGQLRKLGAVEFQRVSNASNPKIELHVDFPTAGRLQEFRDMQSTGLVECLVQEAADVKGFVLKDEHNIEKADRVLKKEKIRCDSEEGARGEMVYTFFNKGDREAAIFAVADVIDSSKEPGWERFQKSSSEEE